MPSSTSRIQNGSNASFCPPTTSSSTSTSAGGAGKGSKSSTGSNGARASTASTRGQTSLPGNVPAGRGATLAPLSASTPRSRSALPASTGVSPGGDIASSSVQGADIAPTVLRVQQPAVADSSIPALTALEKVHQMKDEVIGEYLLEQFSAPLK